MTILKTPWRKRCMNFSIDLNLDAGESAVALQDGTEAALYELVSSVNIACGGHAGDEATMSKALELAAERGLTMGAHPSYPDREGFGRKALDLPYDVLVDSLTRQIEGLAEIAAKKNLKLKHVKPHGALYNQAAKDYQLGSAIIEAVHRVDSGLVLVGLAGSKFIKQCESVGFKTLGEAFVDRRYEPDGSLRARTFSDALITDTSEAAAQALRFVQERRAGTLCIHGDTPHALETARAVRRKLLESGVKIVSTL